MSPRPRAFALALALAVALAAAAPIGATTAALPAPETLTLRLPDVGPSYMLNDDYGGFRGDCHPLRLGGDGAAPALESLGHRPHRGCRISFQRAWPAPGPFYVSSVAFVFEDESGPQAALAIARAAAAETFAFHPADFRPAGAPLPVIGDEAVLLHSEPFERNRNVWAGSIVVWRSGPVLGLVQTFGRGDRDANGRAAIRLATIEQERIAAPTPVDPSDNDDLEVPLDDPRLDVPVYWLGRDLPPRGDLPGLTLLAVEPADRADAAMGFRGVLVYGRRQSGPRFRLGLMHPTVLRRPGVRRELRSIAHNRCTGRERLALSDGRATLYWPIRGCRPRFVFPRFAVAVLAGVAVVLTPDTESCSSCDPAAARYGLRTGLRRLVRALRPR